MTIFKRRKTVEVYHLWRFHCGWCGRHAAHATDGRDLYCEACGF